MKNENLTQKDLQRETTQLRNEMKKLNYSLINIDNSIKQMTKKSNKLKDDMKNTFLQFKDNLEEFQDSQSLAEYNNLIGGK